TAAPAPAPEPEPTEAPVPAPPSGPSDSDAQAYLEAHNTARAQYHASPLTWSDELAALAKQWTAGCKFEHSGGSLDSAPYGENLAAGTGDYKPIDGVAGWVAEAPEYNPSNPIPSHFTQVVWKSSTEVGCAWTECPAGSIFDASYGPAKFHSCMYGPPGNYVGDFASVPLLSCRVCAC
ncbi:PR-1-like protein, partial [Auricularia subglabra TFB-10046 SS5]